MLNWLKGLFGAKTPEVKTPEAAPAPVVTPTPEAQDLTGEEEVVSETAETAEKAE